MACVGFSLGSGSQQPQQRGELRNPRALVKRQSRQSLLRVLARNLYTTYLRIWQTCILKGLRPMPPTRTLNTSRPPDRLQVTSGGPRNQRRDQSIVQAHSVWTNGVLGHAPRTSWGSGRDLGEVWGISGAPRVGFGTFWADLGGSQGGVQSSLLGGEYVTDPKVLALGRLLMKRRVFLVFVVFDGF